MDTFKVGDKAVYPGRGVIEVTAIEEKEFSGHKLSVYVLQVLDSLKKRDVIYLPTSNVASVGLRRVISNEEAEDVFKILKKREKVVESTTWNRRHREYTEKLNSGSVTNIAKVLRDLFWLKSDKELSSSEKQMLEEARGLLIKELAIAKNMTEDEVDNEFRVIFRL